MAKNTNRIIGLLVCSVAVTSLQANMVSNGSFEIGPTPGQFLTMAAGNTSINGWTVGGAGIDYIGSYWNAFDGSRSIDLNGSNLSTGNVGNGSISQSILNVVAGQAYQLVFAMSGNVAAGNTVFQLNVSLGSQDLGIHTYTASGNGIPSPMNWSTITVNFVAASSGNLNLTFASVDPDNFYGPALDNISMEAVPEPFTMALMGGAALGAFAKVRKRRRLA